MTEKDVFLTFSVFCQTQIQDKEYALPNWERASFIFELIFAV